MENPKLEKARLQEALSQVNGGKDTLLTDIVDAALRSAVKAVLPGRQQKGNIKPYLSAARKAFIRTVNRKVAKL